MSGQIPLLIESGGINHSVPDHFETVNYYINGNTAAGDDVLLHICERETVVDSIIVRSPTADADVAASFKKAPSATALASGQAFASFTVLVADTNNTATIDTAHNIVEAGSSIGIDITTAGGADLLITMRIRTRVTG